MSKLKPFQKATVEAVLQAFKGRRRVRRFLVADEVGLGKTLVAQEVIRRSFKRRRPLVVFYVCSNLSIASQNRTKLLEIIGSGERSSAICAVDRLTLMPATDLPTHPKLHLYTLTPETSIPVRRGKRRDGRQEERALIHALVEELWPRFLEERGHNFFQRQAHARWDDWVWRQRKKVRGNRRLQRAFNDSVRTEFNIPPRHHVVTQLRKNRDALDIIAHFRNALAASAIEDIKPDIVIFDEFQRFRDLLSPEIQGPSARVIHRLRGEHNQSGSPALLLLSATPYRLYARRWEDEQGDSHHKEFFDLVSFLYGDDAHAQHQRQRCQAPFNELAEELRLGQPLSERAKRARVHVERILRPVMARTERASHPAGWVEEKTLDLEAQLKPDDLKIFRHLSDSLDERHRPGAVHFWSSIPLPMQTMGSRYTTWREARSLPPSGTPKFTTVKRNRFTRLRVWPHPRLRALLEKIPPAQLAQPWLRPSLPWWSLDDQWSEQETTESSINGKLLVFSRFRAVPQSVAALLSYEMEAALLRGDGLKYPDVTNRKRLQPAPTRHNLLALFHPSPWLAAVVDPLHAKGEGLEAVRQLSRKALIKSLRTLGVTITDDKGRPRPIWQLMARIERLHGSWDNVFSAWRGLHRDTRRGDERDAGLGLLLNDWEVHATEPLDSVTAAELDELVEYAISAPGAVLGRALRRHWAEALDSRGFRVTLDVSWQGLRNYLDQHWFAVLLGDDNYPLALQQAVLAGNLEAVLDEHLWIIQQIRGIRSERLARELSQALQLRSSPFFFHRLGRKEASRFSLRCHAAMPFTQSQQVTLLSDDEEVTRSLRTDELRRSFNSPFWPHVLATTSVGQEGLDFHVWCDSILHWDLTGNPVDMEQREGRLMRFGGQSIRREIAGALGKDALALVRQGQSPWQKLASLAEESLSDKSGLKPWWICEGAGLKRYVFDLTLSEQAYRLEWLKEQRLLYRLVLGLPHQEEFVEILGRRTELKATELREAVLQLSPWFYKNHDTDG